MQVVSHSFAHRAPPATRTRVRWQPYTAIPTPASSSHAHTRSPTFPYIPTPQSSSLSPTPTPLCETDRLRQALPQSHAPPSSKDARDSMKSKHASGLVDQAVKSLCDIWHPYDIPAVFLMSSRAAVTVGCPPDASFITNPPSSTGRRRTSSVVSMQSNCQQLPSPISPSTELSPSQTSPDSSSQQTTTFVHDLAGIKASRSNLLPMKGFVHEVLRRSRTSGGVLQTALCYLEAIRPKVPELVKLEKEGNGIRGEPNLDSRITRVTDDLGCDTESIAVEDGTATTAPLNDELVATIKVTDEDFLSCKPISAATPLQHASDGMSESPSANLPSPLLCPRRAFLAALILASKFTQDRCYSNRAWAKLSGLPAREIGRCERALGDALDWRLWVGKKPVGKGIGRTQSESTLLGTDCKPRTSRSSNALCATLATFSPSTFKSASSRTFRRHRTVPSECFGTTSNAALNRSDSPMAPFVLSKELSPFAFLQPSIPTLGPSFDMTSNRFSPISPVPSLFHSPSSTESSSGDRTIQMAAFLDDTMGLGANPSLLNCVPSSKIPPFGPWDKDIALLEGTPSTHPFGFPASNYAFAHTSSSLSSIDSSVLSTDIPLYPFDPQAMMDGVTGTGNTIPEPMVGVVYQGPDRVGTGEGLLGDTDVVGAGASGGTFSSDSRSMTASSSWIGSGGGWCAQEGVQMFAEEMVPMSDMLVF